MDHVVGPVAFTITLDQSPQLDMQSSALTAENCSISAFAGEDQQYEFICDPIANYTDIRVILNPNTVSNSLGVGNEEASFALITGTAQFCFFYWFAKCRVACK
jgi:hypothetical protein